MEVRFFWRDEKTGTSMFFTKMFHGVFIVVRFWLNGEEHSLGDFDSSSPLVLFVYEWMGFIHRQRKWLCVCEGVEREFQKCFHFCGICSMSTTL